ncbi:MAG: phage tail tape measure protein [Hominimerdicola sp.]
MALEIFKLFGSIFVNNDDANKSISKTKSEANQLWESFKTGLTAVSDWAAGIGSAAISVGKEMITVASDAETAFAKTQTLLTADTDMTAYYNDIMELSKETGVAFSELTEATYSAISASVDQADAVEFVNQMNKLAVGGFTSVAKATDVVTTAINAYGLEAGKMTDISDKLITTQNLGKTSVDELASSMGNVIPTANSVGVDLDNLCAAYAQLTAGGMNTAAATTNINAMLLELGTTGSKTDIILREKTGKSFSELMASGKSLGDIMSILNKHTAETGQAFSDIWSSSSAGAAAKAMSANLEVFDADLQAMKGSSGATETAFETMSNTMGYQMQRLTTLIDDTKIELGNALLPTVREFVDLISEKLPDILQYVEDFIPIIAGIVSELGGKLMSIAESILPTLFETLDKLAPMASDILSAVVPFITGLTDTVLPSLLDIIGLILPYIIDIISYISGYVKPIGNAIQSVIEFLMPIIDDVLPILIEDVTEFIDILFGFIESAGADLWEYISNISWMLSAMASLIGGELLDIIEKLIQNLPYSLIDTIANLLIKIIRSILPVLLSLIFQIVPIISDIFDNVLSNAIPLVNDLITSFSDFITAILPVIIDLISQLLPVAFQIIDMILPVILNLISTISPMLSQLVSDILPLIVDLINELSPVMAILIEAIQPILDVIGELLPYVEDIIYALLPVLSGLIYGIVATIDTVLKPVLEVLAGTIRDGIALAIEDLSPLIEGAKDAMSSIVEFIDNVFSGNWEAAWQNIVDIFDAIFGGIGDTLKNIVNTIIDGINYMIGGVNSLSDSFGEISIPDWLGGGTVSFPKIPEIPQLAEGGIAYQSSIVNVGEYQGANTNPEIIAPLDRLQSIMGDTNAETNEKLDAIIVIMGQILNKICGNQIEIALDYKAIYSGIKQVEKNISTAKGE